MLSNETSSDLSNSLQMSFHASDLIFDFFFFLFPFNFSNLFAEMRLTYARRTKADDTTEDNVPSTSGRREATSYDPFISNVPKVRDESNYI